MHPIHLRSLPPQSIMWSESVGQASACLRCGEYETKSRQAEACPTQIPDGVT